MLEALVLNGGTWDGVPETKKMSMSGDGSLAIMLWSADCAWYSPLPHHKLPTAPGILRLSMDVPLPSEFRYRWFLQAILRRMDKGKSADSKQELEVYMEKPYLTTNQGTTYCWLPNICSMAADGVDTSEFLKWKELLGHPQNPTESEFDDKLLTSTWLTIETCTQHREGLLNPRVSNPPPLQGPERPLLFSLPATPPDLPSPPTRQ